MMNEQTRTEVREQFDAICAQVGDWEPLPTVVPVSDVYSEFEDDDHDDERSEPLNELILAGLIAPY
jgi:hypothetical protein